MATWSIFNSCRIPACRSKCARRQRYDLGSSKRPEGLLRQGRTEITVAGHLQTAVAPQTAHARADQARAAQATAPVEYAVAVDRYLAEASLGPASRRVYRISLTSWAWALVGRPAPQGAERRGAVPPVVPLALLDQPEAGARLAAALARRGLSTDVRTVNRELSALRSAVG